MALLSEQLVIDQAFCIRSHETESRIIHGSRHEKYLVITVKNGKVVDRNEVSERPKDMS